MIANAPRQGHRLLSKPRIAMLATVAGLGAAAMLADYSLAPNINKVMVIVDTNYGDDGRVESSHYYYFSLLKSLEAAFELPCLNHACDHDVRVMSDLFRR